MPQWVKAAKIDLVFCAYNLYYVKQGASPCCLFLGCASPEYATSGELVLYLGAPTQN
jgi:hypothetical protein